MYFIHIIDQWTKNLRNDDDLDSTYQLQLSVNVDPP